MFASRTGHSLRLRLMLWYGGLLALGMACFGLLVLVLASGAINDNIKSAINGEARLVSTSLSHEMSWQAPYWPQHLTLDMLNTTYGTAGVNVEILNIRGIIVYSSDPHNSLNLDNSILQKLQQGTVPVWYNANVDGDQALVAASPVYPPAPPSAGEPGATLVPPDRRGARGPMIGVLLVSKSLRDSSATLMALQGFLLLIGVIMLILFLWCGWAAMGYALRPLTGMVKAAKSIALSLACGKRMSTLSQRVKQPGGQDEMAQVVDAFNEMLSSIESSTTSQRRFIADASHELRAPLTTIQGNLAFLIRYIEDIPVRERYTMLADAHGETLRLASLVDELLLLARADANIGQSANPGRPAPLVELDRTLLKLVRQMRRRMEVEGSTLKIEIGRIEPVRVCGDEESMRRIVVILLENAIKYTRTEADQGREKITVALERVGAEAVLRISDTGIGIEERDLPHIFERFYRADQARSREGTGLGLAIAQMLAEQLNGRISAESKPGEGSTFYVRLPLV